MKIDKKRTVAERTLQQAQVHKLLDIDALDPGTVELAQYICAAAVSYRLGTSFAKQLHEVREGRSIGELWVMLALIIEKHERGRR